MKRSKEELLNIVREHGGETPDDYTIAMLEDIADSMGDENVTAADVEALQAANAELTSAKDALEAAYNDLRKSYADRFTLGGDAVAAEEVKEEVVEEIIEETYDSIF